ncbi:MAG: UDPGP type 1 family protein [Lachnospiraceae bacterium]|nr:UDPGP type 1 family protein [Lachnospiraceae bacterium]
MNYEQIVDLLKEHNQEQLLRYYEELSDEGKKKLLSQIEKVDWSLLDMVKEHGTDAVRGVIKPLDAVEITEIEKNKEAYYQTGLKAIKAGKVGAVLLAGGQGTRLGSDKPKGMFNIGLTRDLFIFEQLMENTKKVVEAAGVWVPFYIMTSDKNHNDTVSFFEEHDYFGYSKEHIKFFMQEMAPSVDFDGKLLLEAKDSLSLSPNGNGGWFSSMQRSGVIEDAKARGVEWLNIFAVDNVLQKIADPLFVGAVLDKGYISGAKVVRKNAPQERVGVLCLEDGKPSIVEYYEMTEEMVTSRREDGELTYAFGVILNYLFRIDELEKIVGQKLQTHIVEKKIPYIDDKGVLVKPEVPNGYKFETLILDMIHLFDNCLPYEVVREQEFAPIKNPTGVDSVESARELLQNNGVVL